MKFLFEEVIEIPDVNSKVSELEVSDEEKAYLLEVARSTIHHKVLDALLCDCDNDEKVYVLETIAIGNDNRTTLEVLKEKISDLEEKIINAVKDAEKELLELIS